MGFPISHYDYIKHWHKQLLSRFNYVSDQSQFQVPEYWINDADLKAMVDGKRFKGDCEEFARACMLKYREIGLKARLVVCTVETGEGHCVCEVVSADGKEAYIADNRFTSIMTSDRMKGYTFLGASPWNPEPGDKRNWTAIKKA